MKYGFLVLLAPALVIADFATVNVFSQPLPGVCDSDGITPSAVFYISAGDQSCYPVDTAVAITVRNIGQGFFHQNLNIVAFNNGNCDGDPVNSAPLSNENPERSCLGQSNINSLAFRVL
jgi:hypothetical protein